ncbi:hypothetical protein SAMN05444392_10869 [Seinonella peptonophila]|uniref:Uncharacterized protein n=1 Tax=Seinonella peptonophila TaxID=112248 RepID=A0A1M4Z6T7_9BACL|nr:hypothetical protein [Seinonella peptonophila]SHF13658.1 hypothetical protein SAMN05444392_10869 [Seinonella peptonophila]
MKHHDKGPIDVQFLEETRTDHRGLPEYQKLQMIMQRVNVKKPVIVKKWILPLIGFILITIMIIGKIGEGSKSDQITSEELIQMIHHTKGLDEEPVSGLFDP